MNIPTREEGQGLVEYALILTLVAVVVIIILMTLGTSITLVYAQVMGGLNGQPPIDGSGNEVIALSYAEEINAGAVQCSGTVSNVTFVALNDGEMLTSQSVSVTINVNGSSAGSLSGTANANGIATASGSVSVSGACPLNITFSR